ncbi:MAG: sarcosine oxidase [Actinobacteria bacterium]|nr:sarcosine oxidase [Actinomycetota bacterium]
MAFVPVPRDGVAPTAFARRSPAYRQLLAAGARFGARGWSAVALDFGDVRAEVAHGRTLGLADLSPLPRLGFKGPGAFAWLRAQGLEFQDVPNRAWRQPDRALAVTRSHSEILLLSDRHGRSDLCARLQAQAHAAMDERAYVLPRFDGLLWFALVGSQASACLAKLCGVDLRPHKFANLAVAQTFVAARPGVVIRDDLGDTLAYHLLTDSPSTDYFWDCLIDAMAEFGGTPVGLVALDALAVPSG